MSIIIRPYAPSDWDAISRIHDSARLDELRSCVGVEAFLDLASTHDSEGLFDGDVWVGELDGLVAGLDRAVAPVELTVLDGNWPARSLYESEGFMTFAPSGA